jgi:hypothetical protein
LVRILVRTVPTFQKAAVPLSFLVTSNLRVNYHACDFGEQYQASVSNGRQRCSPSVHVVFGAHQNKERKKNPGLSGRGWMFLVRTKLDQAARRRPNLPVSTPSN